MRKMPATPGFRAAVSAGVPRQRPHHRHPHGRDHLDRRGGLRCGCRPEEIRAASVAAGLGRACDEPWIPVRRQHTGFVRAHLIYSDR